MSYLTRGPAPLAAIGSKAHAFEDRRSAISTLRGTFEGSEA